MQYRFLGKDRLKVSAIGYGCPPFQGKLSDSDERRATAVLHRAIEIGVNFIDTADHNNGNNEEILAKALKGRRREVVLTTKFGNLRGQPWAEALYKEVRARSPAPREEATAANGLIDLYRRTGQRGRLLGELARFAERYRGTAAGDAARRELGTLKGD